MAESLNTSFAEAKTGLKLDLACGTNLREGYRGFDSAPLGVVFPDGAPQKYGDYLQHNLYEMPWPLKDNSVAATFSSHFVEHIPHYHPNWGPDEDGWWVFFKELYRVMEDEGICEFIHPFSRSDRAFWDPTHTRYIHYQTWLYLERAKRIELGVNHYAPDIDFEVISIQTMNEPVRLQGRSEEALEFARSFYFNPAEDLFVVLRVHK